MAGADRWGLRRAHPADRGAPGDLLIGRGDQRVPSREELGLDPADTHIAISGDGEYPPADVVGLVIWVQRATTLDRRYELTLLDDSGSQLARVERTFGAVQASTRALEVELKLPDAAPAEYRVVLRITDPAGGELVFEHGASVCEQVIAGVEMSCEPLRVRPGGALRAVVRNGGRADLQTGVLQRVEASAPGGWRPVPEDEDGEVSVPAVALGIPAGRSREWPVDMPTVPGRYRVVRTVALTVNPAVAADLTAEFDVTP